MSKFLPASIIKPLSHCFVPAGKFYMTHQNTILPVAQVGLSAANGVIIFKNAPKIQQTIADAKSFIAQAKTKEEVNDIYKQTLKELAPLVLPIMAITVAQIVIAVQSKKAMDLKDKKIGELSDALAVANNAIVSYQAFQKEAEEKLGEKKINEIKDSVAKDIIEKNPETKDNTLVDCTSASANETYKYFDNYGSRYFYSTMSPSMIRQKINELSIKFSKGEINQYDDYGSARVTINDIYRLIDERLVLHPAGDVYGWLDEEVNMHSVDEDYISFYINGTEDPSNPDHLVWILDLEPFPLFRSRY